MVLIFTDLDGTLLNQDDYLYDEALPTIHKLQSAQIPIIPVTSKTQAEVASICSEIGLNDPFITENGSAIFMSKNEDRFNLPLMTTEDNRYYYHLLGFNYESARIVLQQMSATLQTNLIGFGDLSVKEICQLTGLSVTEGERAKQRDFSEPFLTPKNIPAKLLLQTASLYNCTVVVGDRFSHLISQNSGKGNAVKWLLNNYKLKRKKTITIGLGNTPNDISLLENVDIAIVVPGKKGVHQGLQHKNWRIAQASGSKGWSLAVEKIISQIID